MGKKVDPILLAEFVEEGLAGLGVLDDADELLYLVYGDEGDEVARETLERYNNAMTFVNNHLYSSPKTKKNALSLITEQDYLEYTGQDEEDDD